MEISSYLCSHILYDYDEAVIANPWKAGTMLHRYILIPKGAEGDKTVAMLDRRHSTGARCTTDTVRTPVERSAVFIAPHCQLMYEMGCQKGKEGDKTLAMVARRRRTGATCTTDTLRTPVERSAVFIAPHCQLMYEMGCHQAIRGVCDLDYINIPDVKKRAALSGNTSARPSVVSAISITSIFRM